MPRLILASQSPRRSELLSALGIPFDVRPSHVDETLPGGLPTALALEAVALRKAETIFCEAGGNAWVLAADTAVVVDQCALGKPATPAEAMAMLGRLSGRTHTVITGVALVGAEAKRTLHVSTEVTFVALSQRKISWYVSLDEPYDKAGGYAIQGRGAFLVQAIRGSYTNVVGLPMAETVKLLEDASLSPWAGDAREATLHA